MKFSKKDISDYYDQTLSHYKSWWKLMKYKSLHYGYWDKTTKKLDESLENMNKKMAENIDAKTKFKVLDAGCGVGGAAIFLAKNYNCHVEAVTLNQKQINIANNFKKDQKLENKINFSLQDYTNTNFPDECFEIVWACESVCHSTPKTDFIKEVKRVLKKGGKLILADCFVTEKGKIDKENYIKKWGETWAVSEFNSKENLHDELIKNDFEINKFENISKKVEKTIKKIYWAYLLGVIPSKIYNLTHKVTRFAKIHYLSAKYQYFAYKKDLYTYNILVATKK